MLIKQSPWAARFDLAVDLHEKLDQVRQHIAQGLEGTDAKQRLVATACYLIDALCLRVGDETDTDEADTVGITALRLEHVKLYPDGTGEFRFWGKDSVPRQKKISLPSAVQQNLEELIEEARSSSRTRQDKPQLFPDIDSHAVNAYLAEAMPALTVNILRTHHATDVVHNSLAMSEVKASDPDYKKWGAVVLANLEAAILCNHYKKAPENWQDSRNRSKDQLKTMGEQVERCRAEVRKAKETLIVIYRETREKKKATTGTEQHQHLEAHYAKKIEQARMELDVAQRNLRQTEAALDKVKIEGTIAARDRTWNLDTSLKSCIDPRVFYEWGQQVEYDVLGLYYPEALQHKFAWVREEIEPQTTLDSADLLTQTHKLIGEDISIETLQFLCPDGRFPYNDSMANRDIITDKQRQMLTELASTLKRLAAEEAYYAPNGMFHLVIPQDLAILHRLGVAKLIVAADPLGFWLRVHGTSKLAETAIFRWQPERPLSVYGNAVPDDIIVLLDVCLSALWYDLRRSGAEALPVEDSQQPFIQPRKSMPPKTKPKRMARPIRTLPKLHRVDFKGSHQWGTPSEREIIRRRDHSVNGHPRKLPSNWKRGEDREGVALGYGVILPDGYTYVSPYKASGKQSKVAFEQATLVVSRGLASLVAWLPRGVEQH